MRGGTAPALTGRPLVFGVCGTPDVAGASLSPDMFRAAYEAMGLRAWYVPLGMRPGGARKALRSLPRLGFTGVNVTMPFKPLAAEVADVRSAAVERSGIANTLTITPEGRIVADATDGVGVLEALSHRGVDVEGSDITILGAGGAATEVAFAMAAARVRSLRLWNRTRSRAEELGERLQHDFADLVLECSDDLPIHDPAHVLISAVPRDSLGAELDGLGGSVVVVDLAYRPDRRPTDMVRAARARSLTCIDGREILVRQGAASWRIWFETDAPFEVMARAVA